jgi:hypothetical protein
MYKSYPEFMFSGYLVEIAHKCCPVGIYLPIANPMFIFFQGQDKAPFIQATTGSRPKTGTESLRDRRKIIRIQIGNLIIPIVISVHNRINIPLIQNLLRREQLICGIIQVIAAGENHKQTQIQRPTMTIPAQETIDNRHSYIDVDVRCVKYT